MKSTVSRRDLLRMASAGCGVAAVLGFGPGESFGLTGSPNDPEKLDDGFPRQDLEAVEEVVSLSHFNLPGVKKLITARPGLAKEPGMDGLALFQCRQQAEPQCRNLFLPPRNILRNMAFCQHFKILDNSMI